MSSRCDVINELGGVIAGAGWGAARIAVPERRRWPIPDRVVVINDISEMRGGATGVALMSLRQLRERGVPVTFITGDNASRADMNDVAGDCEAIGGLHILAGSRAAAALRGLYNREAGRFLEEWISRHDTPATIYHLHGWSKILSPSVFGALKKIAPRLIVHAHDFFLACPNGGYFDFNHGRGCELRALGPRCLACNCDRRNYAHKLWRSGRLALRKELLDLKSVRRVLAVHEAMVPLLRQAGLSGAPVEVLRNPVVPWRAERVPAERNNTFLFVGRLDADKGVDLLAAAARRAGVQVRMIGAGPMSDMLARAYPEIELTGWKSRDEIAELCREARAIVLPTRSRETFGLAALEAMMSGLPAVISHEALLASETVAHRFGLSCDPKDEGSLARLLSRLARDDESVARMSKAAHAGARELAPTPAEWCEQLLDHYSAALGAVAQNDEA